MITSLAVDPSRIASRSQFAIVFLDIHVMSTASSWVGLSETCTYGFPIPEHAAQAAARSTDEAIQCFKLFRME